MLTDDLFAHTIEDENGCWIWQRSCYRNGYGQTQRNKKKLQAHRLAYCLHRGLDLDDIEGQVVRHSCDVRNCINPEHLLLGTKQNNTHDMVFRNRHGFRKLTDAQCAEIKKSSETGVSLARKYNVSTSLVSMIRRGEIRSVPLGPFDQR
jgi:hypothetical protein